MDTLIELLKELAALSGPALWLGGLAIVGLFAYKIFIVGSIYGVVKFCAQKIHDTMVKERPPRKEIIEWKCTDYLITGTEPEFKALVAQVDKATLGIGSKYLHESDIQFISKAVASFSEELAAQNISKKSSGE